MASSMFFHLVKLFKVIQAAMSEGDALCRSVDNAVHDLFPFSLPGNHACQSPSFFSINSLLRPLWQAGKWKVICNEALGTSDLQRLLVWVGRVCRKLVCC
jgi:hypothetical protein